MSLLTYPHIIRNPVISSHIELNDNFNAVSALVNGALGGDNFSPVADLVANNLSTGTLNTTSLTTVGTLTIKLPSNDGTHSVTFNGYQGSPILKIKSDGKVAFGGLTPFLAIGTVLMYNGTGITNADTRTTELSELLLDGWFVCNGQASTPDLRNKSILGATFPGVTGGSNDATVPQHTHTVASATNNSTTHTHTVSGTSDAATVSHAHTSTMWGVSSNYSDNYLGRRSTSNAGNATTGSPLGGGHSHTFTNVTSATESSTHTHSITTDAYTAVNDGIGRNRPPFYSLIFIRRMS